MASLTLTKASGVLFAQVDSRNPKSYFGEAKGTYQIADDNERIRVSILEAGQSVPDVYNTTYSELTVGTSTAPNIGTAEVLLNAVFQS